MNDFQAVGRSYPRKEAWEKGTGAANYTNDLLLGPDLLHAKQVLSTYAHAKIRAIDLSAAWQVPGVRAILTGHDYPILTGEENQDRPPIAIDKVRYFGETVAVVVADTEVLAKRAAELIRVEYEPLPVINSPTEALQPHAPLIHENVMQYRRIPYVYPEPQSNIANRTKIRKGDLERGWEESECIVSAKYSFPPSDHVAMETRCASAEILSDGRVIIYSSTQAPYAIKKLFQSYFNIPSGNVTVITPLVGGAFGGKAAVQLEIIVYLASLSVNGRKVKLVNSREEDLINSPCHIGLEATVKLGATRDGFIRAAEILYLFDGGAYSDKAADISRAAGVDCTGPYDIDNVWCDSLCVYTNHTYATSFRGFGHPELAFAMERTIDQLAHRLEIDPLELRYRNAIRPGDTTPTQSLLNRSNVGDLPECIERVKELICWEEGQRIEMGPYTVRAKGVSCLWKTSNIDTNSSSGAVLMYNPDGSINLSVGVVEIGTGTKTALAQILAEKLRMDIDQIHVRMTVDTDTVPEHWKTVASRGTFMAGRAVLQAAEDAMRQLRSVASCVLRTSPEDLEIGGGKVYVRAEPRRSIDIKDIAYGYTYPGGNSIGGQVIGRGHYILRHLTNIDRETGRGEPGPEWTVGAAAVEVELDTREFTYRILKAVTVLDIGKVINPTLAKGQVTGAMNMGLSFASREAFHYDDQGKVLNPRLRVYPIHRISDAPEYLVDFVETPFLDAPFGLRGIGEHGVIGMPGALANSLSVAAGVPLNQLPLYPEYIWKMKMGAR